MRYSERENNYGLKGIETRQWIVKNYDVMPVANIQLLTGQTNHSDARETIKNKESFQS